MDEETRLNEPAGMGWKRWGPYLSERQWGTVREDYSPGGTAWEAAQPRCGPQPGVPLGRGWAARHQRRSADPVLRAGVVERARPDPEGAAVRPDQQRRESRRRRQGVLLLPRRDAHPFVSQGALQVSPTAVSVCGARGGKPATRQARSGVRADRQRRLRREPLLRCRHGIREALTVGPPHSPHGPQPWSGSRGRARAAAVVVPQHLVVGPSGSQAGNGA